MNLQSRRFIWSTGLKMLRVSLPMLTALALAAPLSAEEITAPEPQWQSSTPAAMADSATTAEQAPMNQPGALSAMGDPISPPSSNAGEANTLPPEQEPRKKFRACAPSLTVVHPGEDESPLAVRQKFKIFYRYTYDPCLYAAAAAAAGIKQAQDEPEEYGQGAEGYGKRVGAKIADANLATFFGRFLLPSLLHDDPRFFRMGKSETTQRRMVHAVLSPEWTRRDNGTHRFNYSRVLGDLIAAAIGNAYRPEDDSGAGHTFRRTGIMLGTASGSAAFAEFWPDIKAKLFKKHKQEVAQIPTD